MLSKPHLVYRVHIDKWVCRSKNNPTGYLGQTVTESYNRWLQCNDHGRSTLSPIENYWRNMGND